MLGATFPSVQVQRRFSTLAMRLAGASAASVAWLISGPAAGSFGQAVAPVDGVRPAATAPAGARARLAQVDVVELRRREAALQIRREALTSEMAERAIALYIDPGAGLLQQLVTSSEPNEAARKQALATAVLPREKALIDRLRGVQLDLRDIESAMDAAGKRPNPDDDVASARLAVEAHFTVALPESVLARLEEVARESAGQELAERSLLRLLDDLPADGRLAALFAHESMTWPAEGGVSSEFGWRWGRAHKGLDVTNDVGTPITAARSGRVVRAVNGNGFGNHVIVDHGQGLTTLYGHLAAIFVAEGAEVQQGEVIGAMGCTGSCTGTHLHFEVRQGTVAIDPRPLLPQGRAVAPEE